MPPAWRGTPSPAGGGPESEDELRRRYPFSRSVSWSSLFSSSWKRSWIRTNAKAASAGVPIPVVKHA